MKLMLEDDFSIKRAEKRYLDPPEYDDLPTFYIDIDVDTYDEVTGDNQNIVIKDYELTNEFITDEKQAEKWIEENLEDIILDEMDNDSRFDDYENFENVNIIINDIDVKGHPTSWYATESLNEANGNLKQQVEDYLNSYLDSTFESGLVNELYSKVNGYDPDWAADTTDNSYAKARNDFIQATMRMLFTNFNK